MEINEDQPNEKAKTIYQSCCLARETATFTCVLPETQRQTEEWESFLVERGQVSGMAQLEAVVLGKLQQGSLEVGTPVRLVRYAFWLSLVDPELGAGVKVREAVS